LPELGYVLTKAIVDDPPTVLLFKKGRQALCLIDTFNYFRSSLKDLGDAVGLPKLKMPSKKAKPEDWLTYCQRDVEIIKASMLAYLTFIKDNNLGNFQYTIAAQAFTAYRHRFMPPMVFIDNSVKALDMARAAYHGGRTEAFFIGEQKGDFYLLDVNSMYPCVMAFNLFPQALVSVYNRTPVNDIPELLKSYCLVADVDLVTTENVFPMRSKEGLLFPVGKFRTMLSTPELTYAYYKGYIRKVHRVALYTRGNLFEKYIRLLYSLRKSYQTQDNKAFEFLCKLMLNSLYGKFGQSGRVYEDVGKTDSNDIKSWTEWDADTHQVIKCRQFAGVIQNYKTEGESFNSHPAIACHVTAYARMMLWQLICTAGIDNVYYCDTDSLVVNRKAHQALSSLYLGDDLGELKLVKRFKCMVIYGPKDYEFGNLVKIKGVSKKAKKLDESQYRQEMFSRFRGMLREGDLDTMKVTQVTKYLHRIYKKGTVLPDGKIEPFKVTGDFDYEQWLAKRYEPKFVRDNFEGKESISSQDKLVFIEDDLEARRNKAYPYQHKG